MAEKNPVLTLDQATTLSLTYSSERLGGQYRFGVRASLTINAVKVATSPAQGQIGNQVKFLDDLVDTQDYCTVMVNGKKLTDRGKINSFSLGSEGGAGADWTQVAHATFSISVFHEGNLEDLTAVDFPELPGTEASDWPLRQEDLQYLEEFSESFDFGRGDNSIDYSHKIDVKFSEEVGATYTGEDSNRSIAVLAGLELCKKLLTESKYRPAFDWLEGTDLPGLYADVGVQHKRFLTENVDTINHSVSVEESFSAANLKDGDKYGLEVTQVFTLKEGGIIDVAENGTVTGLRGVKAPGEKFDPADSSPIISRELPTEFMETEIANARKPLAEKGRLQLIFAAHKTNIQSCDVDQIPPLKVVDDTTNPENGYVILIEKGISYDYFAGTISYKIKGTNDEKIDEVAMHEYTKILRVSEFQGPSTADNLRPYLEITQQGKFTGNDGKKMKGLERPQYEKAKAAWNALRNTIKEDLRKDIGVNGDGLYSDDDTVQRYHVSISNTYSPYKGSVGYNITYSDSPDCPLNSAPYKKLTFERKTDRADASGGYPDPKLFQYNTENVLMHPKETQMIQKRYGRKTPSSSQKFSMVGKKFRHIDDDPELGNRAHLSELLLDIISNPNLGPGGTECSFLKSASYTFNEDNDKLLNINFSWE